MKFFNDYSVEIIFIICIILSISFLLKYGSHNKSMEMLINDDLSRLDSLEIKVKHHPINQIEQMIDIINNSALDMKYQMITVSHTKKGYKASISVWIDAEYGYPGDGHSVEGKGAGKSEGEALHKAYANLYGKVK